MLKDKAPPSPNTELVQASDILNLLEKIRPEWQAKNLIQRVMKLLSVDPGSACQRIFNAAIHDLKGKINIAGIDIASEAAKQHKLPPVSKYEDIENYSTSKTIDLAYRMGLLSRPEYRRITRAYDIRKDLEHEDDVYEAGIEDCVYMFKTCIDIVLSKDPVHLLKLTDIKDIVESPEASVVSDGVLDDYQYAPPPRQLEIYKFLIGKSLDVKESDIVRQNCYRCLHFLREFTRKEVLLDVAKAQVEKIARNKPDLARIRINYAAGTFPYLKRSQISIFFKEYYKQMLKISSHWKEHISHGKLLRTLKEVGGLKHYPDDQLKDYCLWFVLCYIGEPGNYGEGLHRNVFYSNSGAPLSLEILQTDKKRTRTVCESLEKSSKIRGACKNQHVARRFEEILEGLE